MSPSRYGLNGILVAGSPLRKGVFRFRILHRISDKSLRQLLSHDSNLMVSTSPRLDQVRVFESALGISPPIVLRVLSWELIEVRTLLHLASLSAPEWLRNWCR